MQKYKIIKEILKDMSEANECLKEKLMHLEDQKELLTMEMNSRQTELEDKMKIAMEKFKMTKSEFELEIASLTERECILTKQHEDIFSKFVELSEEKNKLEDLLKEKIEDIDNLVNEKMDLSLHCEEKKTVILDLEQTLSEERKDYQSKLEDIVQELKICKESLTCVETETLGLKNQLEEAKIQHDDLIRTHENHVTQLTEGHKEEVEAKVEELKICQKLSQSNSSPLSILLSPISLSPLSPSLEPSLPSLEPRPDSFFLGEERDRH